VRAGGDGPVGEWRDVYEEMLLQVCSFYNVLPDIRGMEAHEIKFFYEGARQSLESTTKGK
jgi:hypothetical protein